MSCCSPCRPVRILANSVTWPARVAMLSARWARLEVPGDHQDVRVAGQESGQAHLGRRSVQGRGRRQHGGVLGHLGYTEERRAEGEVRHPRPGCAPGTNRGGASPSGRGGCRRSGDAHVALGEECVRAGGTGTISPRAAAMTSRPGSSSQVWPPRTRRGTSRPASVSGDGHNYAREANSKPSEPGKELRPCALPGE